MTKRILVSLVTAVFLAGTLGTLAGCNTMEGAGKDVEQGGKAIKNEAREQKNKM
jgi:predicted small secreted protein